MPTPEINVRLTADGVQDVINAFRRVQDESKRTKEEVTLLGQAGEQLGELMPVLTIGAAVAKIVELGKGALESSVSIGKLAEKTGASVGTLSVLAMAAHDVGVEQDQLGTGLVRLARNMENASNGNAQAQKAFKSLGISMTDVKAKNPADLFVEIAQKMQQMPDGATKAAVSMQLFGRAGADLIPVLNEVGQNGGFEELERKAKAVGLYLSDDFVAQAKQSEMALRNMQDATKGLATQFDAGFIPEATKALVDLNNTITAGGTDIKKWGTYIGAAVDGVVNVFLVAGQTIGLIWSLMWSGVIEQSKEQFQALATIVKGNLSAMNQALHGDFSGAWETSTRTGKSGTSATVGLAKDNLARQKGIWSSYKSTVLGEFANPAKVVASAETPGGGASGDGESDADKQKKLKEFQKLVDARSAYEDSVANSELQKQKLRDQQAEADDKERYDAGLETLDAYYNARATRINSEADAEKAILEKKLSDQEEAAAQLMGKSKDFIDNLIQQGPKAVEAAAGTNVAALALLQKVGQTRAQIDEDEIKRQTQLSQNATARTQAQQQVNQRMLSDRQKLYELEGNTSAAQKAALDRELADTEALMIRLGIAEDERKRILSLASANAGSRNSMNALSQSGGDAFTSLQTGISAIQDKANAGTISDLSAETQIYALEKQRLPTLQAIADRMQQVADDAELPLLWLEKGSDAYNAQLTVVDNLQKQVDQYTQKLNSLNASLQTAKTFSVELSNQLYNQGASAFVSFFDAGVTGAKSFGDALNDLGTTFEKIIVHMIDQMMVYYALMALVGWIAPNSNLYTSLSKSGPFSGLTGHAGGGFTGNAPTNKVTGVVHGQEFVLSAAATKKYGLPMLQAMNAGTVGSVATGSSYGSMSGAASAADSGPLVQLNIDTNGQPAQTSQKQGPNGTSILDIVIGQVAGDIASGGKVAQSIQTTYGVSRRGNRRG